jgi:hypothetical protein
VAGVRAPIATLGADLVSGTAAVSLEDVHADY